MSAQEVSGLQGSSRCVLGAFKRLFDMPKIIALRLWPWGVIRVAEVGGAELAKLPSDRVDGGIVGASLRT